MLLMNAVNHSIECIKPSLGVVNWGSMGGGGVWESGLNGEEPKLQLEEQDWPADPPWRKSLLLKPRGLGEEATA